MQLDFQEVYITLETREKLEEFVICLNEYLIELSVYGELCDAFVYDKDDCGPAKKFKSMSFVVRTNEDSYFSQRAILWLPLAQVEEHEPLRGLHRITVRRECAV